MTTYYGLYGQKVQYLASDPTDVQIGQVWYNSTSATLKVRSFSTGTWASGGNMNTSRYFLGGAGTQTAALGFGGYRPNNNPGQTTATEEYDGTSWTSGGSLASSTYGNGSLGTQTAALSTGGTNPTGQTEEYDGTSWTAGGARADRYASSGTAGTQTAGLGFGNYVIPTTSVNGQTESYNGTTWTTLPATMNTARSARFSLGATDTAALAVGGTEPTRSSAVESWNGSTWTNSTSLPVARAGYGASGTQTLGVIFGGSSPVSDAIGTSLEWNGTAWSSGGTMATARNQVGGSKAGTQASALAFAGDPTPNLGSNLTEEYTGGGGATKTVTVS